MLCVKNSTQEYIDCCRPGAAALVSAYQALVAIARNETATDEPLLQQRLPVAGKVSVNLFSALKWTFRP